MRQDGRAISQLRQLLDFYFEPFNLQHNRYLLDLVARNVATPDKAGPWPAETLLDLGFGLQDLAGLGRIAAALSRLRSRHGEALSELRHLWRAPDGRLRLRKPPEIRRFVAAEDPTPDVIASAHWYLTAVLEQRGRAPPGIISILSYAIGGLLTDHSEKGQQWRGQLKRQLLLHHTDLMCLLGLDPEGDGAGIAETLTEDGYAWALARGPDGEANCVFWDRNRLALVERRELGAALAVDLRTFGEDPPTIFRVICARPTVPTTLSDGLGELFAFGGPLLVCVDLSLVGGAESASVVEELAALRSLPRAILGEELAMPLPAEGGGGAARGAASGLNKLHRPDGMLFRGMAPLLALSGHSESYLAAMAAEDVAQQLPALRIPLVAAFDWRAPPTSRASAPAPAV